MIKNININKKKPKQSLSPQQENRLLKIIIVFLALAIVWLLCAPGTGVFSLLRLKTQAHQLEKKTEKLAVSNKALKNEIDRLKNDPEYLERIAREKYGLIKKNEHIYEVK